MLADVSDRSYEMFKSAKGRAIGTTMGTAVAFMAAGSGSGKGDIFSSQ